MQVLKIAALFPRLAALVLPLLIVSGCSSVPSKPTLKDSVPRAGCSERTAGLPLPPPPLTESLLDWREAYIGAARAYTSQVELRIVTADCLDKHREPQRKWWQRK